MIPDKANGYLKTIKKYYYSNMNKKQAKIGNFNPIKEDESGKRAKRVIWSTNVINMALEGLDKGKRLVANPFYENNSKLLKAGLVFHRTPEEIEEWKKCAADVIYFAKQCKLMTPEGIQYIELRPYQEKYLRHLEQHNMSIYLAARQSGKTTTSAIFLLWYILFNFDKNALVLGNKGKTAKEILDKIKKIFYELPFYLRPGVEKWNEMELVFDNGCRIMAETTTTRSGISFTFHCVLADEFAHIMPNILDEFYENLLPVITAAKARLILSSTQNGRNLFYRLYTAAVAGENEYSPFKTDWYEVPEWNPDKRCWEKRDEAWRRRQVANYGSEEAFNRQFGTSFDSNSNTLISNQRLREVDNNRVNFVEKYLPGWQQYFVWREDYEPAEMLRKDPIIITCDLAEGGGNDYTTFLFNRIYIDENDMVRYECVGMFHSNEIPLEKAAYILRGLCLAYMVKYNFYISVEMNTYGDLFIRYMKDMIDGDGTWEKFSMDCFLKFKKERMVGNKMKVEYKIGVRLDAKEKLFACMNFKTKFERREIDNYNTLFLNEAYNFCDTEGHNTYKAAYGHDDIFMAQMQLVFFERSNVYNNFIQSIRAGKGHIEQKRTVSIYDMLDQYTPNGYLSPNFQSMNEEMYENQVFERFGRHLS